MVDGSWCIEDASRDITQKIFDLPRDQRGSFLEGIVQETRPVGIHIDHWRYDVHCLLINNYQEWRDDMGRPLEHAEALAYLNTVEAMMKNCVYSQPIRPISYRFVR